MECFRQWEHLDKFEVMNFLEVRDLKDFCWYEHLRMGCQLSFREYKLSPTNKKLAKSQKFLPAKLSTLKVV